MPRCNIEELHHHLRCNDTKQEYYENIKKDIAEIKDNLKEHGYHGDWLHVHEAVKVATKICLLPDHLLKKEILEERVPFTEGFIDKGVYQTKRAKLGREIREIEKKSHDLNAKINSFAAIENKAEKRRREEAWMVELSDFAHQIAMKKSDLYILNQKTPVKTRAYFLNVLRLCNNLIALLGERADYEMDDESKGVSPKAKKSKASPRQEYSPMSGTGTGSAGPSQESRWSPAAEWEEGELEEAEKKPEPEREPEPEPESESDAEEVD